MKCSAVPLRVRDSTVQLMLYRIPTFASIIEAIMESLKGDIYTVWMRRSDGPHFGVRVSVV